MGLPAKRDPEVEAICRYVDENLHECPMCGGSDVEIEDYDFGIEPMTGYALAGSQFRCHECGASGEYE